MNDDALIKKIFSLRGNIQSSMQWIKGEGESRGEKALVYCIPNNKNPKKPTTKRVTKSEFIKAYKQLCENGEFTKPWFNNNITCKKDGGCNFIMMGNIFLEIGEATFYKRGVFSRN